MIDEPTPQSVLSLPEFMDGLLIALVQPNLRPHNGRLIAWVALQAAANLPN
jgi:hypothetical protein